MKLNGRASIVTGASVGLGAAIADRFAAEGSSLMICARNGAELEKQRGQLSKSYPNVAIHAVVADVAKEGDVDRLFAAAAKAFGKVDILVNNAGIYGPMGSIDQVDWKEWVDAIAINLTGNVYCARKAVQLFRPQRYGKIINLSGGGATNPLPRDQRLRGLQGRHRPLYRDPGAGGQGRRDRRQRRRAGRADDPADRPASRRRPR